MSSMGTLSSGYPLPLALPLACIGSRWLCTHSHPSPQSIATRRSPLLLGRHPLHGGGARGRADARRGRARAVGGRHWRSRRLPRTCARHNFGPPITRRLQAHGQIQIQIQSGRSVGRSRSRAAAKGAAPGWRAAATGQPGRGAGLRAAPLSAGRPDRCPGGVLGRAPRGGDELRAGAQRLLPLPARRRRGAEPRALARGATPGARTDARQNTQHRTNCKQTRGM